MLPMLAFLLCAGTAFAGTRTLRGSAGRGCAWEVERRAAGEVRVTYLGTNGYQFEAAGHVLLVDPYFSRVPLCEVAFNQHIESDPRRVEAGLAHLRPRADAILATHAHFDHLLDVPAIMRRTGATADRGADGDQSCAVAGREGRAVRGCSAGRCAARGAMDGSCARGKA